MEDCLRSLEEKLLAYSGQAHDYLLQGSIAVVMALAWQIGEAPHQLAAIFGYSILRTEVSLQVTPQATK